MFKLEKSINSYLGEGYVYISLRGSKIKDFYKDAPQSVPSGYTLQALSVLRNAGYVIVRNLDTDSIHTFRKDILKYAIIDDNFNTALVERLNCHPSFLKVFGFSNEDISLYNPSYSCDFLGLITYFGIHKSVDLVKLFKNNYNNNLVTEDLKKVLEDLRKNKTDGHFNMIITSFSTNDYSQYKSVYGYPYSISEMSESARSLYSKYPKIETDEQSMLIYELIKPYSYGIEIETSGGTVPLTNLLQTDYVFLKDGSISGYEFTSLPFFGPDGITKTKNFLKEAIKNCNINQFCSLHVHLGNVETDKKSIVALYKTIYQTQQELFDFMPNYKREVNYFTSKQQPKDHCKPLKSLGLYNVDNVDIMYNSIRNFITSNNNDEMLESSKWNQFPRYHHLNLLNLFNSTGSGTIEFRLHEPTLNFYKIMSWLLITSALVKYSNKYQDQIINNKIKISLKDVMIEIYPQNVATYLIEYIKERTIYFSNRYCSGNYEDYNVLVKDEDKKVFKKEEFESLFSQVSELV